MLNENKLAEYFLEKVENVAKKIYNNDILDSNPEKQLDGTFEVDYLQKFKYLSPKMMRVVKREALKLKNDLKEDGFDVQQLYCETEIINALNAYAYGM